MKIKIKKLLFEYSRNSRITTKELGRKIGASQQSASYLLKSLKKKKLINDAIAVIDAIKLGFMDVIVGFNLLNPDAKKEVIDDLKLIPEITSIEEGREGVDILVEYTIPNLSAFNKSHSELIYRSFRKLRTAFIFPMIVSHEYYKNYLSTKFYDSDVILFGDRILRELTKNENKVLIELVNNPTKKIIDISESLKMPVKSIAKIKKNLEKKFIIKGYSSIFNYSKLGINRDIVFFKFSGEGIGQMDKFYEFTKNNKNIVKFIKIIGEYDVAVYIESIKENEIIREIRANFPIEDYLIVKSEKVHKKRYLPDAK